MIKLYRDYLSKHSFCLSQISETPNLNIGIIVVIPCFNEPDLISSMESLWNCLRPQCSVEVIVVINAPINSNEEIIFQNEKSFSEMKNWVLNHDDESLKFFCIKNYSFPEKHAGVGLARKIGMDEAIVRFEKSGNEKGIIVCFDADSTCDKNYLTEIESHFKKNPETLASSIYFEHPVDERGIKSFENISDIKNGIIQYELFIRYYRQGLKFANHPAAFHTIGSSMAVRSDIYCKQGGMNRRKAGEDFYFLHKMIPLGNFSEINSTKVIPSPRPSFRVPFGTGRAISDFIKNQQKIIFAYHPQIFADLKILCEAVPNFYRLGNISEIFSEIPISIQKFLIETDFEKKIKEISENSSSKQMFIKRFFRWFDGFIVLKFTHFSRNNFYKNIPVSDAAKQLFLMMNLKVQTNISDRELLEIYRNIDRNILI